MTLEQSDLISYTIDMGVVEIEALHYSRGDISREEAPINLFNIIGDPLPFETVSGRKEWRTK